MDDSASYFGGGMIIGAFVAVLLLTLFALPAAKHDAYERGLCHGHGGIQVEIADTLACIQPPQAVRMSHEEAH